MIRIITNRILLAAKYGSWNALEIIVERYSGLVLSIATQFSPSRPRAEQCAKDIMNSIIEHLWDYKGAAKDLSAWVINYARLYLRKLYKTDSPKILKFSELYVSYKKREISKLEGLIGFECYYILMFKEAYNMSFESISKFMNLPEEKVKEIYETNYDKAMNIIKRIKRK